MARWKLTADHYLNVPGTQWEYEETSRESGKKKRETVPVPLLIELKDPQFQQNVDGDVIVCWEGKGEREGRYKGDIVFLGDPTPDMEPLDDEAEARTNELRPRWEHPIDTLPANGGMTPQEQVFMEMIIKAMSGAVAQAPNTGVSSEAFAELQKVVAEQAALIASLTKTDDAAPTGRRL